MIQEKREFKACQRCFRETSLSKCQYSSAALVCKSCAIEIDRVAGFLRFYGVDLLPERDGERPPPYPPRSENSIHPLGGVDDPDGGPERTFTEDKAIPAGKRPK